MLRDGYPHQLSRYGRAVVRRILILLILSVPLIPITARAGDLLVASFFNHKIVRFAESNGAFVEDFVPAGTGGLTTPHAIGYGPDGHLYVATLGGGSILRFDGATGAPLVSSTGTPGTAEFVVSGAGGLGLASGFDFGIDGNLYVSDLLASRVLRFDGTTGAFVDVFVAANSGGLDEAESITVGPGGHLYVCSSGDRSIMRYESTTGAPMPGPLGAMGTAEFVPPGSGGLSDPHGLTFGPDGNLYVASLGSSSVIQYEGTTGALMSVFVSAGVPSAHGLVFGNDGRLYVGSFGSTGIAYFDGADGSPLGNFVMPGDGGLSGPASLTFCPHLLGDIDGDGVVDLNDVEPFVDSLLGSPQLPVHLFRSDLNGSGGADGEDIMVFVGILLGQ